MEAELLHALLDGAVTLGDLGRALYGRNSKKQNEGICCHNIMLALRRRVAPIGVRIVFDKYQAKYRIELDELARCLAAA